MMLEVTARTIKRTSYPAYKDSGVEWLGDVPAHWEVKRGRFCADVNPQSLSSLHPDIEVSFVPMEAVGEYGGLDLDQTRSVFEVGSGYTEFKNGDVVVAKITPCFENGKGALAMGLLNGIGFGTTELHVPRPFENLDVRFLFYFSISQVFRSMGEGEMYGAGGQKRVPPEFCKNIQIPLPPVGEQNSIANFLDRETKKIDTLLAKKRTLIERLKEERTALITHTVTRGLPPEAAHAAGLEPHLNFKLSGVEWLGDVPEHWEICKLKRVTISRCDGPFGSSLKSEHYSDTGVRVIRLQNTRFAQFDDRDAAFIEPEYYEELGDHNVLPYDLLIAGLGDENYPVGRACVAPSTLGTAMVKADCFRFRLMPNRANSAYVALQLSTIANALAGALATGTTRGRMNLATTENRDIALPPLSEQTAIADFLDRKTAKIDTLVTKIEIAIERLQERRLA